MNIWHRFLLLVCVFRSLKLMNVKAFLLPVCVLVFVSSHAMADQNADELPDLFTQLKNETSSEASTAIEHQIWRHWLQAPNRNSASLLSQVTQAMSLGRLDIALTLSNQLVDSAPEFAEAWNKRATIHFLLGQDANSVADIRETVKLEPIIQLPLKRLNKYWKSVRHR